MPCPTCGHEATQASVYRVAHVGLARTPTSEIDYRQDFKDFTEASAELEFKHSRMEEAAGRTIATPPLATLGMKKARELQAKGVRDSLDYKARG